VGLVGVLLLGGWFWHFCSLRLTLRPTPRPECWAAKIAELDPPPTGALSAERAAQHFAELEALWVWGPGDFSDGRLGDALRGPWEPEHWDLFRFARVVDSGKVPFSKVVADGDPRLFSGPTMFDEARQPVLATVAAGWAPGNDPDNQWSFGFRQRVRHMALWLVVHSRWAWEQEGDLPTAVEDWLTVLRMGRELQRGRRTDSLRDGLRIQAWAVQEMIYCALANPAAMETRGFAEQVADVLGPLATPENLVTGERLAMHARLEQCYVREGGDWLAVDAAVLSPDRPWVFIRPIPTSVSRVWNVLSPVFHDLGTARSVVDEYFDQFRVCTNLVACESVRRAAQADRLRGPGPLEGFTRSWRVDQTNRTLDVLASNYRVRCSIDAAVTMFALHEYRRRHGEYPETLAALVPDDLVSVPLDCADHQPLRYRREGDSFILYSIGQDGRDDGGSYNPEHGRAWHPDNADAVFSAVRRPERGSRGGRL